MAEKENKKLKESIYKNVSVLEDFIERDNEAVSSRGYGVIMRRDERYALIGLIIGIKNISREE